MCRLSEIKAIQLKNNDSAAADPQIDSVKESGGTRFTHPKQGRANQSQGRAPPGPRKRFDNTKCGSCGGFAHKSRDSCPAYGQNCHACGKRNHFKHMCRSTSKQGAGKPRNTKKVQELGLDREDDELFIGETIQIQDVPVKFKLHTGSETDVLPYNIYQKLSNVKLQPSYVKLRSHSGHHLSPKGQAMLNVNGSNIKFQIVSDVVPILGHDT